MNANIHITVPSEGSFGTDDFKSDSGLERLAIDPDDPAVRALFCLAIAARWGLYPLEARIVYHILRGLTCIKEQRVALDTTREAVVRARKRILVAFGCRGADKDPWPIVVRRCWRQYTNAQRLARAVAA